METYRPYVLVVEDHNLLRRAIHDLLADRGGYEVGTAADGVEALALMAQRRPDLIVADIMMPRMDGYEFYAAVRQNPSWASIPFIFLTAKAETKDILVGKGLGAEDYITKPFTNEELLVVVEARLRRARELAELQKASFEQVKQRIINVLGHELRTPLTYLQGYTSLALDELASSSPGELSTLLAGLKLGSERLTRLIEDLLLVVEMDLGRFMADLRQSQQVTTSLGALVQYVAKRYRPLAARKNLKIEVRSADMLPPVLISEAYVVDALQRLVDNAIKFSDAKSQTITLSTAVQEPWVLITVADQGMGIPPEKLPELFQRFGQIDREKHEQQGLGLGLYIARELIRAHGGEIEVTSVVGSGSTFTIRLPIVRATAFGNEAE